jgi:ABC-type branched-subunit amino acid transport system substrate-binding protein
LRRRQRLRSSALVAASALILFGGAACSRGGSGSSGQTSAPAGSPTASSTATTAAAGQFGSATKVCAPGPGTGGSGRGISGKTIRVGVMADPGSTAAPGLGQEFFDVADAFAKWCNAAGGINGRTIVVDKHDAKLFNVAPAVIAACQKDFMLVGGGNGLDAPGAAPRVACKLGQIPAYVVSPQALNAGYQVTPVVSTPDKYPVGVLRLLAQKYPETQQAFGIAGSALASLTPQGLRAQEAWQQMGYKSVALQARPALVDNYSSWMQQFKSVNAKADFEITATNLQPILTAVNDTGFKPSWILYGQTIYNPKSVQAAKSVGTFPPSYINLANLPWEVADQYPVVQQAKDIMSATITNPQYDAFTSGGFNAWVLWAQSATACGDNLTQECVLQKAGAQKAWTAGGLYPPVNTDPALKDYSDCVVIMQLTTNGWVLAKDVTKPNDGVYNCDPKNLTKVKSYETGS